MSRFPRDRRRPVIRDSRCDACVRIIEELGAVVCEEHGTLNLPSRLAEGPLLLREYASRVFNDLTLTERAELHRRYGILERHP